MKSLKFIFRIMSVFIILAVIALIVFVKTFDIGKYRVQIIEKLSAELNRPVLIDDIELKFAVRDGVQIKISGFSIADSQKFSDKDLLNVKDVWLNINFLAYILQRQILISEIKLVDPVVYLLQNKEQELNVNTLLEDQGVSLEKNLVYTTVAEKERHDSMIFPALMINSFKIVNATVHAKWWDDDVLQSFDLRRLDIKVANFALDTPFKFQVDAAILSDKQNIQCAGLAQFDVISKQIRLDDFIVSTELKSMSFKELKNKIPALAMSGIQNNVAGKINLNVGQLIIDQGTFPVVSLDGGLRDGHVKFKELPTPFENVRATFQVANKNIHVLDIFSYVYSGKVLGEMRVEDYEEDQKLWMKLDVENVGVDELLKGYNVPVEMEGEVLVGVNLEGTLKDLLETLTGTIQANLQEGKIVDLNVLDVVLSKLTIIPNLRVRIYERLSEEYKERLTFKDTMITKAIVESKIKDSEIYYTGDIETKEFLLSIDGILGFDKQLKLSAHLFINEELSKSFVDSVGELGALLDSSGRISFPFKKYEGTLERVKVVPDLEVIGTKILKTRGKQELHKVILKALDIEEGEMPQPSTGDGQELKPVPKKSIEEQLLDTIIGEIPIFK